MSQFVDPCLFCGFIDFFVGDIKSSVSDIFNNSRFEKSWFLRHNTNHVTEILNIHFLDIITTDANSATLWIIKALNKLNASRFTTARLTTKGNSLPIFCLKRYFFQNLLVQTRWICEIYVLLKSCQSFL